MICDVDGASEPDAEAPSIEVAAAAALAEPVGDKLPDAPVGSAVGVLVEVSPPIDAYFCFNWQSFVFLFMLPWLGGG